MNKSDTIAAIATGMVSSGIGIVRVSGADALSIASLIFKSKSGKKFNNQQFESHRAYYGFIYYNDKPVDEVLLLYLKGPKSFTAEDTVEINCHGGIHVLNKVLSACLKAGARLAEPGEFTRRAFLNGRIDLSEAEAVIDIINSGNDYSLNNSLSQLRGSLFNKITELRSGILHETAYIEAALDDPEHYSLDGFSDKLRETVNSYLCEIEKMILSYDNGKIIMEGINTVILGKPNVGKSSLLNMLLGEKRAIVTDIAGTTRDALTERVSIGGINLNIADTAGIRDTEDIVEKIGVDKAFEYADKSNLIILVIDSSSLLDDDDLKLFDYIKDKNAIVLLNKSDLNSKIDDIDIEKLTDKKILHISAKEEQGLDELSDYIKTQYISGNINDNSDLIISNIRHKDLLSESYESLKLVINGIDNMISEDFLTIDLVNAYECLGRIIGEEVSDDVIKEVFEKFCMGK